jgi:D-3-phosphoglycerate dehydrogenase
MLLNKNQSFRILIVDDIHPVFIEMVQAAGFLVDYRPSWTYEDTLLCIADYHVLVLRSKFKVNPNLIDLATNLKLIARAGAGVDNIDVDYAKHKNIKLISANEGNCDAVAEHMLGMLLSLLNNLRVADAEIHNGIWKREENRGTELSGKTVGLIGYGNNGQAMARKLSGFGVKILAYDKYRLDYGDATVQEAAMATVFEESDILSLHIPLTKETKGLIDKNYISKFRKTFYLLNGSRGGISDMESIVYGLEQGKIIGAAFDVLPIEDFPALNSVSWFGELKKYPNVILSPHVAGWTVESYFKIAKVLAEKLVKVFE